MFREEHWLLSSFRIMVHASVIPKKGTAQRVPVQGVSGPCLWGGLYVLEAFWIALANNSKDAWYIFFPDGFWLME